MPYKPYGTVFKDTNAHSGAICPVSIYPLTLTQTFIPPAASPVTQTVTFSYTENNSQEWNIPTNIYGTNVSFVVIGAAGTAYASNSGGKGGKVSGNINVSTIGTSLGYFVGTTSTAANEGGEMSALWAPNLSTYLVVAGGGGGGGAFASATGGDGGHLLPSGSANSGLPSGLGGGGASNGTSGNGGIGTTQNGLSGTSLSTTPPTIPNPPIKNGGAGALVVSFFGGTGGDGYAGGGGGGYTATTDAGGGGGGSSYANTTYVSSVVGTKGVTDLPSITLTWLEYP